MTFTSGFYIGEHAGCYADGLFKLHHKFVTRMYKVNLLTGVNNISTSRSFPGYATTNYKGKVVPVFK